MYFLVDAPEGSLTRDKVSKVQSLYAVVLVSTVSTELAFFSSTTWLIT